MSNKELIAILCADITHIKTKMESVNLDKLETQISSLAESQKELLVTVKEVLNDINNPETGIIVSTNKNTEFRVTCEKDKKETLNDFKQLQVWSSGVNKGLWVLYSAGVGIIIKLIFFN